MPELPSIAAYLSALDRFVVGAQLRRVELKSVFLLRSVDPPLESFVDLRVVGTRRLGKRIALCFEQDLYLLIHLMVAGRLRWRAPAEADPGRITSARLIFDEGRLLITEASKKKRASLFAIRGAEALAAFDRGGLEVLEGELSDFRSALVRRNHTLKRALTDPTLFSGIGNAYSDEILHRARLSPFAQTQKLSAAEQATLYEATRAVLDHWITELRSRQDGGFPEKVTAFEAGMAVHGRYGQPCPVCEAPIQRIRYASNETNYCARCQTGGKIFADRALSRLLKDDFPRRIEDLLD